MKVRVKVIGGDGAGHTLLLHIEGASTSTTFTVFKDMLRQQLVQLHGYDINSAEFVVSLNKLCPLGAGCSESASVGDVGVVGGDLLYVTGGVSGGWFRRLPGESAAASTDGDKTVEMTSEEPGTDRKDAEMSSVQSSSERHRSHEGRGEVAAPMDCTPSTSAHSTTHVQQEQVCQIEEEKRQNTYASPQEAVIETCDNILTNMGFLSNNAKTTSSVGAESSSNAAGTVRPLRSSAYLHATCPLTTCATLLYTTVNTHILIVNVSVACGGRCVSGRDVQHIRAVVDTRRYVATAAGGATPAVTVTHRAQLETLVRDALALPLLAAMQTASHINQTQGIQTLPLEMLLVVLYYMPIGGIVSLCRSNRLYRELITNSDTLWRMLCNRDFPEVAAAPTQHTPADAVSTPWRQRYISAYRTELARARAERERRRVLLEQQRTMPPQYPVPIPPGPHMPPGLIGDPVFPGVPFPFGGIAPGGVRPPRYDPIGPLGVVPPIRPRGDRPLRPPDLRPTFRPRSRGRGGFGPGAGFL